MKHRKTNFFLLFLGKILLVILTSALFVMGASRASASPPPSPISFPDCEKILQEDRQWIGSVCPEQVWTNGIPYPAFAIYYFGFLATEGDYVMLHFRVDGGQERTIKMARDTGMYYDMYNRNLFEARYIPYVPAHPSVDLEIHFSRRSPSGPQMHDEYGRHFRVSLKM